MERRNFEKTWGKKGKTKNKENHVRARARARADPESENGTGGGSAVRPERVSVRETSYLNVQVLLQVELGELHSALSAPEGE